MGGGLKITTCSTSGQWQACSSAARLTMWYMGSASRARLARSTTSSSMTRNTVGTQCHAVSCTQRTTRTSSMQLCCKVPRTWRPIFFGCGGCRCECQWPLNAASQTRLTCPKLAVTCKVHGRLARGVHGINISTLGHLPRQTTHTRHWTGDHRTIWPAKPRPTE